MVSMLAALALLGAMAASDHHYQQTRAGMTRELLKTTIIPKLSINDLPVEDAFTIIEKEIKSAEPRASNLNFSIEPRNLEPRISFAADGMSALHAVDYFAQHARGRFSIGNDTVSIRSLRKRHAIEYWVRVAWWGIRDRLLPVSDPFERLY
jgi:hypothetical protein